MAPSRSSRTLGALLALHAGDALGAPFEFKPHTVIHSLHPGPNQTLTGGGFLSWPPGAATDDTDLTRAVLLAYRDAILSDDDDNNNTDVVTKAVGHFLAWYRGDHWPGRRPGTKPRDIGRATRRALTVLASSRGSSSSSFSSSSSLGAGQGHGSAGNGSLMRCIPTGLFQTDPELLVQESLRISAITHNDPRCTVACAAYNTIVSALVVRGLCVEDAVSAGERVAVSLEGDGGGGGGGHHADGPVYRAMKLGRTISLKDLADKGPRGLGFPGSCSGFVLDSLTLAVAAVLDDKRSLDRVLVDVVRVGMDTDTNAAIAGGLLGARDGEEAVLDEWKVLLQFGPEFRRLVDQLLTAQGVFSSYQEGETVRDSEREGKRGNETGPGDIMT